MNKLKRNIISTMLISAILSTFIIFNFTSVNAATSFSDVSDNHWAAVYIRAMQDTNIINGYPDGTFKPEEKVKTGEFIKMIAMIMYPKYNYVAPSPDEPDGSHWAKPYVLLLDSFVLHARNYDDEIMEEYITREDAATLISKLYMLRNQEAYPETLGYIEEYSDCEDVKDEETKKYINNCMRIGIINGFEDGTIRPKDTLTRAQAAKLIFLTNI